MAVVAAAAAQANTLWEGTGAAGAGAGAGAAVVDFSSRKYLTRRKQRQVTIFICFLTQSIIVWHCQVTK